MVYCLQLFLENLYIHTRKQREKTICYTKGHQTFPIKGQILHSLLFVSQVASFTNTQLC